MKTETAWYEVMSTDRLYAVIQFALMRMKVGLADWRAAENALLAIEELRRRGV